jgi:hypothetical protein
MSRRILPRNRQYRAALHNSAAGLACESIKKPFAALCSQNRHFGKVQKARYFGALGFPFGHEMAMKPEQAA